MTIDIAILLGVAITSLIGGFFAGTLYGDSAAYSDGFREGRRSTCQQMRARMHRMDSDTEIIRYIYEQLEKLE
jgi:hypothetical protein